MIVVCGEALVDMVLAPGAAGYRASPGGSPANVATALGRLDVPVSLLARLSTDHFGQLIRAHLEQSHVDLSLAVTTSRRSTLALAILSADGDASYDFAIEGGADGGWDALDLPVLPADANAVHVSGSFGLAVPRIGDALEALLIRERPHRVITVDPNPRPALTSDLPALRERLRRWVSQADVVKISSEDLDWTFPGRRHEDIAADWLADPDANGPDANGPDANGPDANGSGGRDVGAAPAGPSLVVITRGAEGVYALGRYGASDLPAEALDLVDTVGAGDSFMAGLLANLHRAGALTRAGIEALTRAEVETSLRYAQKVAAITCGRAGADPPWSGQVDTGS